MQPAPLQPAPPRPAPLLSPDGAPGPRRAVWLPALAALPGLNLVLWAIGGVSPGVAVLCNLAIALPVAAVLDHTVRRTAEVQRTAAAATSLARNTAELVGEEDPLPGLVERLRATFGFDSVSLLARNADGWELRAAAGRSPATRPGGGWALPLGTDGSAMVVVRGGEPTGADRTVLRAFVDQLALGLGRRELMELAAHAEVLAEADALRQGLLLAVSHDLRTPLAGIKASVTSLLASDVTFTPEATESFLRTIDAEVDRLDRVVGNLLDAGRLQGGTPLAVSPQVTALDDVVAGALDGLDPAGRVRVEVPDDLPALWVDGPLVERSVANVVANALVVQPDGEPVRVIGAAGEGDEVLLEVVDRGPGIPTAERDTVFEPFQRLGDRSSQAGVGLGLAIARGFTRAVGGDLELRDTPGGGLTVRFRLPAATDASLADPGARP